MQVPNAPIKKNYKSVLVWALVAVVVALIGIMKTSTLSGSIMVASDFTMFAILALLLWNDTSKNSIVALLSSVVWFSQKAFYNSAMILTTSEETYYGIMLTFTIILTVMLAFILYSRMATKQINLPKFGSKTSVQSLAFVIIMITALWMLVIAVTNPVNSSTVLYSLMYSVGLFVVSIGTIIDMFMKGRNENNIAFYLSVVGLILMIVGNFV